MGCGSDESPAGTASEATSASSTTATASSGSGGSAGGGAGGIGGVGGRGTGGEVGYDCLTSVEYFVEVSGDGAATKYPFANGSVAPADAPAAARVAYPKAGSPSLVIGACLLAPPDKSSLELSTPQLTPGMSSMGTANYHDAAGDTFGAKAGTTFDLTKVDDPGGVVEGSYSATVVDGTGKMLTLTGAFRVCRFPDLVAQ